MAIMNWKELLSPHRLCTDTPGKITPERSPFQRDFDRIVFSGSFRRLHLDPATFVELWRSGGGNNCTGWGSAEFDKALVNARESWSADARRAHLYRAENIMMLEQPIIPLYWSERTYLKDDRVQGWNPLLLDNHPLDAVQLKP